MRTEAWFYAHNKIHEMEQENAGVEGAHKSELAAEGGARVMARHAKRRYREHPARNVAKWERKERNARANADFQKMAAEHPELSSNPLSRIQQKWKQKRQYAKEAKKVAKNSAKAAKKTAAASGNAAKRAARFVTRHPVAVLVLIVLFLLCYLVAAISSIFPTLGSGLANAVSGTSYASEDTDLLGADEDYTALERELADTIASIESDHPGYDEYRYDVDTIGHDPNELIAYLTVKFGDFKPDEVQAALKDLFEQQYTVTLTPVSETRYKTVSHTNKDGTTSSRRVAYTYKILYVTVRNRSLGTVVRELLTEDEYKRYLVIFQQKGNRPDIFGDNIYANPSEGPKYEIPGEALSDPSFKALITEAEKYLGWPYVWGGSSPSTSFDCSGFVCWVYTASGVHNLPRTTATGIYNQCTVISKSEAKPGDLVFFTKTYDCDGPVSHIGIYVGNGMMIHAGSPIKYASIETSYWQEHFYAFGRL